MIKIDRIKKILTDLLTSKTITTLLFLLVITFQLQQCNETKEHLQYVDDRVNKQTDAIIDSVITTFVLDKAYFDSAESLRQNIIMSMRGLSNNMIENQGIMLNNQMILLNTSQEVKAAILQSENALKEIKAVQVDILTLQQELMELANHMKNKRGNP